MFFERKKNNDFLSINIENLIDWNEPNGEGCIVSDRITKEGFKVGYMYREAPDEDNPDSGWRFLAGNEDEAYMNESSNHSVFSINTILCFSNMPLKLGIYAGIFSALLGLAVMIYTLCTRKGAPSGYATIVVLICFMFAMMFVIIGIIGEYIAILFTELKDRPVYIVDRTENIVQGENAD